VADNEQQFQERTEQATPKRLQEARRKGQIARSRELNMALVMITAAVTVFALRPQLGGHLASLVADGLTIEAAALENPRSMVDAFASAGLKTFFAFTPLLGALCIAAVLGGLSVGGWAFSLNPLEPKFSKLDPIKGIKRVFGLRGLVEVAKALAKAFVVGGIALGFMWFAGTGIFGLSLAPLDAAMADSGRLFLHGHITTTSDFTFSGGAVTLLNAASSSLGLDAQIISDGTTGDADGDNVWIAATGRTVDTQAGTRDQGEDVTMQTGTLIRTANGDVKIAPTDHVLLSIVDVQTSGGMAIITADFDQRRDAERGRRGAKGVMGTGNRRVNVQPLGPRRRTPRTIRVLIGQQKLNSSIDRGVNVRSRNGFDRG